jgi:putative ABC transport system permease protein
MTGSWRVALRLAWRDVTGHPRRTLLTASLIGLPVLFAGVFTAFALGPQDFGFAIAAYLPIALLIVLLAIPAFGVTARSRRDQLDLLESAGGTSTDARRTITAVGLVTGVVGVVGGLVLAVPGWIAMTALVNRLDDGQHTVLSIENLGLWPLLALMGLGASTAAAVVTAKTLPGHASGDDTVPSRSWLAVGAAVAVIGLWGVWSLHSDSGWIAPWTTLLGLGVVLVIPTLVHLVGRVAASLPLAARLAARDADRHRMRTAPAVAAVMAGVAAVTALGIGSFSDNHDRRAETQIYQFPVGAVSVYGRTQADLADAVAAGAEDGVKVVPIGTPADDEYVSVEFSKDVDAVRYDSSRFDVVIADADTLAAWGVHLNAAAAKALDSGSALAGPTVARSGGRVRATLEPTDSAEGGPGTPLVMPAVSADLEKESVPAGVRGQLARLVIPPELAQSLELTTVAKSAVVDRRAPAPTDRQVTALRDLPGVTVDVQGKDRFASYRLMFMLLTLLGVGIVGLATATAVALARIDGREDADTLVSVGARPVTARGAAAAAALLIGGLGSVLGVAVGLLPGIRSASAMTGGYGDRFIAIPWALLAVVGVVIPLVVAAIAFVTAPVRPGDASPSLR